MTKYEFTLKVRTKLSPSEAIWYITQKIKDAVPVLSIDYDVIEDRATNDEHHGGIIDNEK